MLFKSDLCSGRQIIGLHVASERGNVIILSENGQFCFRPVQLSTAVHTVCLSDEESSDFLTEYEMWVDQNAIDGSTFRSLREVFKKVITDA